MLPSPCINVCRMDPATDLCVGCYRTIEEITRWSTTDDQQRARILQAVAERRQADAPSPAKEH